MPARANLLFSPALLISAVVASTAASAAPISNLSPRASADTGIEKVQYRGNHNRGWINRGSHFRSFNPGYHYYHSHRSYSYHPRRSYLPEYYSSYQRGWNYRRYYPNYYSSTYSGYYAAPYYLSGPRSDYYDDCED